MNIEPTIAKIPDMTADQRKVLRANAEAKLTAGDPKWAVDAPKVLAALDAFDAEQRQAAIADRAQKIAQLEAAPGAAHVLLAFELEPPTQGEAALIQTLLDHPGSTNDELTALHGWIDGAWDMQFGGMCARRKDILWPLAPAVREILEPNIHLLTIKQRYDQGVLHYCLKPEAVEAFKQMGFRLNPA